jgi:uncharacterized repeat protein (TIGR02543 family)
MSDITVIAQWTPRMYTLTVELSDGTVLSTEQVQYGRTITSLPVPQNIPAGYSFTGWTPNLPHTVSGDVTFIANIAAAFYRVRVFLWDGGPVTYNQLLPWNTLITDSVLAEGVEDALFPANPIRRGYTWRGWSKDFVSFNLDEDVDIVGLWDRVYRTLTIQTYNSQVGLAPPFIPIHTPINVVHQIPWETTIVRDLYIPEREGHTFTGWPATFVEGMVLLTNTTVNVRNNWTINSYNLTIYSSPGVEHFFLGTPAFPTTALWGTAFAVGGVLDPGVAPTPGYEFQGWSGWEGWNADPALSRPLYLRGNTVVTGIWARPPVTVTVVLPEVSGFDRQELVTEHVFGSTLNNPGAPALHPTGYRFMGWVGDPVFPMTLTAAVTLTAIWQPVYLNLTTTLWTGNTTVVSLRIDTVITQPPSPAGTHPEGARFVGWNVAEFPFALTEHTEVTAIWHLQVVITFLSAGGSNVPEIVRFQYEGVSAPARPTRTGYDFTGWFEDIGGVLIPVEFPFEAQHDRTFNAVWIALHRITFNTAAGTPVPSIDVRHGAELTYNFLTRILTIETQRYVDGLGEITEFINISQPANTAADGFGGWWISRAWLENINQAPRQVVYSLTLYARYTFILTFNPNAPGIVFPTVHGAEGMRTILPSDIQRPGFWSFDGWYSSANFALGTLQPDEITITARVTLFARWRPVPSPRNISAGGRHTLYIDENGRLFAWGANNDGAIGDAGHWDHHRSNAVQIRPDINWGQGAGFSGMVSAGQEHSLAIDAEGRLWVWGRNHSGQIGHYSVSRGDARRTPLQLMPGRRFTWVAAGWSHSLAIDEFGNMWGWGDGGYGRVGDGTTQMRMTPVQVGAGQVWWQVAAGQHHTIALTVNGNGFSWGGGGGGNLGIGVDDTTNRSVPTPFGTTVSNYPGFDGRWISITAGDMHSAAISASGRAAAWGIRSFGRLGDGAILSGGFLGIGQSWPGPRTIPYFLTRALSDSDNAVWSNQGPLINISAGGGHTLAVSLTGQPWSWGVGNGGRLGDGIGDASYHHRNRPVRMAWGTSTGIPSWATAGTITQGFVTVAAGQRHAVGVDADGNVWAWGESAERRLGDGTPGSMQEGHGRSRPFPVAGLNEFHPGFPKW